MVFLGDETSSLSVGSDDVLVVQVELDGADLFTQQTLCDTLLASLGLRVEQLTL